MDPLLEKYLNDEINDDQFNEELTKLTPEQQQVLQTQAKDNKASTFTELKAIRAEKNRVEQLAKDTAERAEREGRENQVNGDYGAKFRNEQVEVAKQRFFEKFKIPESDRTRYESEFKKSDSGNVSADLIYNDFVRIYGAENASTLIERSNHLDTLEQGADEFNAEGAGSGGGSGGGSAGETKKYPAAAYTLVAQSKRDGNTLTLDEAARYLRKGGERNLG